MASTSVALAATVLTLAGSNLVGDWQMDKELQGAPCQAPNICVPVDYQSGPGGIGQAFWDEATGKLQAKISNTPGEKVVLGYSQAGIIAANWLQNHAGDDDAPPADELSFVLFGAGGDAPTDTQYKVINIARE